MEAFIIYVQFSNISLHDELSISPIKTAHSVQFNGLTVPMDNTCTMLDLLQDKLSQYWHINIDKHIPAGAGLGGGSSNAATLMALNELESLNLTVDDMVTIMSQVGPMSLYMVVKRCVWHWGSYKAQCFFN